MRVERVDALRGERLAHARVQRLGQRREDRVSRRHLARGGRAPRPPAGRPSSLRRSSPRPQGDEVRIVAARSSSSKRSIRRARVDAKARDEVRRAGGASRRRVRAGPRGRRPRARCRRSACSAGSRDGTPARPARARRPNAARRSTDGRRCRRTAPPGRSTRATSADGRPEVADVGVRPDRDRGVEGLVLERQRVRAALDRRRRRARARRPSSSVGDVDADRRPAELGRHRRRHAGPAADVQAAPVARSPSRRISAASSSRGRAQARQPVVPLRDAVVARFAHRRRC